MQDRSTSFGSFMGSTPPAVKFLLIVNIAAFVLAPLLGSLINVLVFQPRYAFLIWPFVTYMFLHGGFAHIFFNMFALWMFGRRLEYRWGTRGFFRFFLTCGVGAAVVHLIASLVSYFLFGNSFKPIIGASGAIMGLLIAYALLYGEETVYVYFVLPMKVKYFVLLLGILDAYASWGELTGQGQSQIAHFAHLGGLITGWFYIKSGNGKNFRHFFRPGPKMVRPGRVHRPHLDEDTWR